MDFTDQLTKQLGRPIGTACNLLENVLSVPTQKLGDLLGDNVSHWQWRNRIRIFEKASVILEKKGLTARELPLGFSVPLLRECGDLQCY